MKRIVALTSILLLSGCHHNVPIEFATTSSMSDTIFLTPVRPALKTVFVDMKNTSGDDRFDLSQDVRQALTSKGYAVIDDPESAQFVLQANVLSLQKANHGEYSQVSHSGALIGGLAGAGMGAAIGSGTSPQHAAGGGAALGLFGLIVGSMIDHAQEEEARKLGLFKFNVNIMVSEKAKNVREISDPHRGIGYRQGKGGSVAVNFNEETNRKKYQTDLSVKTNAEMSLDEAVVLLKADMVKAIAGIF